MQDDKNQVFNALGTGATISFYLISSVVAGIFLGRLVDGYFDTYPWGAISGIVIGMISGMWAIYKKVVDEK